MRCVLCKGPWHPATGYLIGSPVPFPCCGRCFHTEIMPLLRWAMAKRFRIGKDRWMTFYDHVNARGD